MFCCNIHFVDIVNQYYKDFIGHVILCNVRVLSGIACGTSL